MRRSAWVKLLFMNKNARGLLRAKPAAWLSVLTLLSGDAFVLSAVVAATPDGGRPQVVAVVARSASAGPAVRRVVPLFPALVAGSPQQKVAHPPLTAAALASVERNADAQTKGRLQIGLRRPFDKPAVVGAVSRQEWTVLPDGWRIWAIEVSSVGALGMRVHLDQVSLPERALVLAYSAAHPPSSVAPLTSQDLSAQADVWTETVFEERVIIECQVPPEADVESVRFSISDVSHMYALPKAGIAKEGACENDVTCFPEWAREASGTARILFVEAGNTYLCTGCLIDANDPGSVADYFLTANHCIGNQAVAATLELFWFYQTAACKGPSPALGSVPHTAGGADLLAGSSLNDFAFLRLRRPPPGGASPLSWTATPPANGEGVTTVHHPGASYKRISFGKELGSDGSFWQVQWSSGVTEPGSSGSPLFNSSHQIIGQLYGGNSSCTVPAGIDVFGRFDLTYNAIKAWIDPTGPGYGPPPVQVPRGATYYSLFQQTGGISPQSSGSLVLTTGAKNRFTASIRLGNTRFAVSGQFNAMGSAEVSVRNQNVTVTLQLDPSDTDNVSGQISTSDWSADLSGNRATFNSRSAPAPQAGRYTLVFSGGSDAANEPAGNSYGILAVNRAGRVNFFGRLADGTAVSQSTMISRQGLWPLYLPLYAGQGLVLAWLNLGDSPGDITGDVSWIRPAASKVKYYSSGFAVQCSASGSPYVAPSAPNQLLDLTSAALVLDGVKGAQTLTYEVSLSGNRIINLSDSRLNLSLAPATGMFSGRGVDSATGRAIGLSGVVLQNRNIGAGFYVTGDQVGPMWLRAR